MTKTKELPSGDPRELGFSPDRLGASRKHDGRGRCERARYRVPYDRRAQRPGRAHARERAGSTWNAPRRSVSRACFGCTRRRSR